MNKYLVEILKIQSSVILPGLGALMVPSQKSGKIVFNPHLKFNDGSLAKYISEKEGIEQQEAQNRVAKFVREIEAELGKGNTYNMFEFGEFYKNKDGDVDFNMFGNEKPAEAAVTPPVEKKEKPVKEVSKPKAEEKVVPEPPKKEETKVVALEKKEPKKEKEEEKKKENIFIPADSKNKDVKKDVSDTIQKTAEEIKAQVNKKVDAIKKEVEAKSEATKENVKSSAEKAKKSLGAIISGKTEPEENREKQSKNTFVPPKEGEKKFAPVKPDTKENEKSEKLVAVAGSNIQQKVVVKEKKKKKSKLPWIILLLLLIGLSVTGYFFKDKIIAFFDKKDHTEIAIDDTDHDDSHGNDVHNDSENDSNSIAASDSLDNTEENGEEATLDEEGEPQDAVSEEIEENEEPEEVEEIEEEVKPVIQDSNPGSFHLIGNSFGEKSNADRYVSKMQEKGYPAKVLGRFDGLYLVSIKSFDSREAAKNGRSSVTADASSAWIFKY